MINDPIAIRMVKIVNLNFISEPFVLGLIIIGHEKFFMTSGVPEGPRRCLLGGLGVLASVN